MQYLLVHVKFGKAYKCENMCHILQNISKKRIYEIEMLAVSDQLVSK